MYPSGYRVLYTKAEMCGVDSPLDKAWRVLLYNMQLREQIWLSCRPPQSLVVYMTPSYYAIGIIMPRIDNTETFKNA